ncbi:hypothetical protein ACTQ54_02555 [Fundicoccus sp. Sow4_H7]|uniref:hypothetical protein n=1 Tax=Fundicoccus sp. Sow4_H7 TaxID=3438784 RepID=UPI003F8E4B02
MNQILNIAYYVFVIAYSLLTMLAAYQDINLQGFQYWHSFYFIGAILLLLALLPSMPHWFLPVALVLFVIIATVNGLLTNSFQWTHIIVRTVISLGLILIWYQFIK